jgi:hypothetical protein
MPETQLKSGSRQALIALLLFGNAATNRQLKDAYKMADITKESRDQLIEAKLIVVSRGERSAFIHRLTDKGRDRAIAELNEEPPAGSGSGMALLYGMMNRLHQVMTTNGLKPDDVFPGPAVSLEEKIIAAYGNLKRREGELVSLARLRAALPTESRKELDRVLIELDRSRRIQLEPEMNRKNLTSEVQESAVRLGGEDKHLISMESR